MPQRPSLPRRRLLLLPLASVLAAAAGWPVAAWAQGVQLLNLQLSRGDGAVKLEFAARVQLSRTVEAALERGVPVYFVAEATLLRNRWYWRDERIARVSRTWRLAFQPLTASWRVGVGAIVQSYPTLAEALAAISRTAGWRLADLSQVDTDARHYLEFSFRLDTSQLPGPMQIGLTGQADWQLGVERTLRLD